MKGSDVPKPLSLKCGLWLAWLALLASVLVTLWATISPSLSGVVAQRHPGSIRTVLFLSVVMLLTPAFAGYWTGALMLALAARRVRWARWILLIGAMLAAALLVFNAFASPTPGRVIDMPLTYVRLSLLLANAVAVGLMFTTESGVWFRGNASGKAKDDLSRVV